MRAGGSAAFLSAPSVFHWLGRATYHGNMADQEIEHDVHLSIPTLQTCLVLSEDLLQGVYEVHPLDAPSSTPV